jgi:guanylate kinase
MAAKVFVITGPSGVGKGTLIRELKRRLPELELSISATTRAPRAGEVDGADYYFLSAQEFERRIDAKDFLEFASYSDNHYGTLRSEVERRLEDGRSVVLEIEVQGAQQVRAAKPDSIQIFVAPPGPEILRERLLSRGTDSPEAIDRRLEVAKQELAAQGDFAHLIVNDDLGRAADELEGIVRDELGLAAPG